MSLELFHPLIKKWFLNQYAAPTDIQEKAWQSIAAQEHVLITSPTGSGKTLAAFLWAINQFVRGAWEPGQVRVLYISPLKALNNDVQRNLLSPLEELRVLFGKEGQPFPPIGVETRSGDTPQQQRRRILKNPPGILITTPESLNILLSSKTGRQLMGGLCSVILDEIHAVAANKRGTYLMTAVDRLVRLSGEFQRIGLSATVKPLSRIGDFIGGYELKGDPKQPAYLKRPVRLIRSVTRKEYQVRVCFPENGRLGGEEEVWWDAMVEDFVRVIQENRSTLLFANSRRATEKAARLINTAALKSGAEKGDQEILVYSHHGSLAREIRLAVEQQLKAGALKGIVATNSLELGIDIGELDQVVLIQTPFSISSAIQRAGRSGHRVGEASRTLIYPTHGKDFLYAAVMAPALREDDIEEFKPIEAPLDVLAQIIISMTLHETWDLDELYSFLKSSYSYHKLSRKQFNLVLDMLAGRYADSRVRELKPRVSVDKIDNTVAAKEGVQFLLFSSGGTIPDRGYYNLRLQDNKAKIGELDEEFVWERNLGETFSLGNQVWRIQRITSSDVEVTPAQGHINIIPFWRAEGRNRDFHFSALILEFLKQANDNLENEQFTTRLCENHFMEQEAAFALIHYLKAQVKQTGAPLPHRYHIVVEHFDDPLNRTGKKQVLIHTLWGSRLNRPFAFALAAAWEEQFPFPLEIMANDDAILLMLPHEFEPRQLFDWVKPEKVERLLRVKLEQSGFFGARFRENAGRALLLPRGGFKKRLPLWINRLRSKKLMDAVMGYEDFPILLESWRECLRDEFDLENLKAVLEELLAGKIRLTEVVTKTPSPFARDIIWQQTNLYLYQDDTPRSSRQSNLTGELIKEVASSSQLRPHIPEQIITALEGKLQRTSFGYAPETAQDLLDWIKERLMIPKSEWHQLLAAMAVNPQLDPEALIHAIAPKLLWIKGPGATIPSLCALENLPRIRSALDITELDRARISPLGTIAQVRLEELSKKAALDSSASEQDEGTDGLVSFLSQWLSFYGPISKQKITTLLGLGEERLDTALEELMEEGNLIFDQIREAPAQSELCDLDNLEILLVMLKKARQPVFQPLALNKLPLYLAVFQKLVPSQESFDHLPGVLEQLIGCSHGIADWEEFILPSRVPGYRTSWLDRLFQTTELAWYGCGKEKITFGFPEDHPLLVDAPRAQPESAPAARSRETGKNRRKPQAQQSSRQQQGGAAKALHQPLSSGSSREAQPPTPDSRPGAAPGPRDVDSLLPGKRGKYSFYDLKDHCGLDTVVLTKRLWDLAWQGVLSNDSFSVLRFGVLNRFKAVPVRETRPPARALRFNQWKASRPLLGHWFRLNQPKPVEDLLRGEELLKERIRLLFLRYGILFRELLVHELPVFRWSSLLRSLRLLELSGEITSGVFFKGITGSQFASYEALRVLRATTLEEFTDSVYWINATDPASLCGMALEELKQELPSRIRANFLVYHGARLVMVAKRNGKETRFYCPPEAPELPLYLNFFKALLSRDFNPEKSVEVETINGCAAVSSPYKQHFLAFGFKESYKLLKLYAEPV